MIPARLLIDTFTPQTLTRTADGMGGFTEAWTDGTDFKGRLSTLSVEERMSQDKETSFKTYKIYCAIQTIDEAARIKLGTRYFEIKSVIKPSNLSTGHLEILVKEID